MGRVDRALGSNRPSEGVSAEAERCWPRYVSLLPVIPVTLRLNPREALEGRHPQDGRSAWPPPQPGQGGLWEAGPKGPGTAQAHRDLTLYK